jgi:hypothetical protein
MNEKTTTRRLGDPLLDDRTDWDRLHRMTDQENEASIARDFDSWPLDDQARGYFFHVHPADKGGWTWEMVDRRGRVVARAPISYDSRTTADAATRPLKKSLKAA